MTRALRFYSLLAVIMGGEVVSIVLDQSSWPYATFGMFSYTAPAGRTLQSFVPVGVARDGSEIPLEPCLRPLSPLQIHQGIALALQRSELRTLLQGTFEHCAASHPLLAGVRVDDTTWQLTADLDLAPPRRIEIASYP